MRRAPWVRVSTWALPLSEMGAIEGSEWSEPGCGRVRAAYPGARPQAQRALGPLSRGLPWRDPVWKCGGPVATSPESPRSIWNPVCKLKALLAGVQLPGFLNTLASEFPPPPPPSSPKLFISCFVPLGNYLLFPSPKCF